MIINPGSTDNHSNGGRANSKILAIGLTKVNKKGIMRKLNILKKKVTPGHDWIKEILAVRAKKIKKMWLTIDSIKNIVWNCLIYKALDSWLLLICSKKLKP